MSDATTLPTDATGGTEPLLEVSDLVTRFRTDRGRVRAVDGVSTAVDRGESVGVVGESGSGKSVLTRSIMGLLPQRTTERSGTVRLAGADLTRMTPAQLREVWGPEVAMVFQDPMTSLNPVVRVGRQVTESLRYHLGLSRREARDRAVELFRAVGIPEPAQRLQVFPHQLSGGMRQRVTIAIALACDPALLLADEPTTALDVTVQAQILELLDAQRRERNMATVLVTHDFGVAAARTDRILVMYAGRVVEEAPTRRLFREMRHPYTRALLSAIPRLDHPRHTVLPVIPGRPPDLVQPPAGCSFAPRCANAQPRCLEEDPELAPADTPDHRFACFYPVGTEAGERARRSNEQAGHTAAGTELTTTG